MSDVVCITPEQAASSDNQETINTLKLGINQELDARFTGSNQVKISLAGQSEKVIAVIVNDYQLATWQVDLPEPTTLIFSKKQP